MDVLDKEMYSSGNFVKCNQTPNNILDNQAKLLGKYNLNTDKKMPFLYWTAKLHKTPYSHRFITSGRGCTMQPLSIQVGYCLKALLKIIRSNNKYQRKQTNINKCFIVDNRTPVTNFIKSCNQNNTIHSISTFDFKTLYTSIPHDKLKTALATLIRSTFRSRKKEFITVKGRIATLCDSRNSGFTLSIQQLINSINHIIDQNFIIYKGEVFRQCIGIPMGTNCAPDLANLFLHHYEQNYIDQLIRTDNTQFAQALANMFRYQDDMIVFNDDNYFEQHWRDIYPEEMVLEKTSTDNHCTFLDLATHIQHNQMTYKSYDKRNDFNFDIINYPDLNSNVPRNPSYGVFTSQLVRFCDINYERDDFLSDLRTLIQKLVKQNFEPTVLKAKFKKFYGDNLMRWSKYGSDILDALSFF